MTDKERDPPSISREKLVQLMHAMGVFRVILAKEWYAHNERLELLKKSADKIRRSTGKNDYHIVHEISRITGEHNLNLYIF